MKAICPNNPEHKRFLTVAHVMQEWLVDENGDFLEVSEDCLQVSFKPDPGNYWTCKECGATAKVEH